MHCVIILLLPQLPTMHNAFIINLLWNKTITWQNTTVRKQTNVIQNATLRGNCTPNHKLTCFVLYLKTINTFLKKKIYASYSKLSKELKNWIEIYVGPAVLKLWIKIVKILFWSITHELLDLLKFQCYFWVPWTIYYKMHTLFFKKVLIILR